MQVQNIECQIAQAQIGHFLAGSGLSEEAMRQLEDHIATCTECKTALNDRRNELKAMLTGQKPVVDFDAIAREAENTKTKSIATALRKKSLEQMLEPTTEVPFAYQPKAVVEVAEPVVEQKKAKPAKSSKPTNHWKPLLLSLGLAAVLISMSLFSKNIAAIFGPKLSETQTPAAIETPKSEPTTSTDTGTTGAVKTDAPVEGGTTAAVVADPNAPPSTTESTPTNDLPTENAADQTNVAPVSTGEETKPTEPQTTPEQPTAPIEPEANSGSALGASAGALATTQFEATEEPVVKTPPVEAPKPVATPVAKPAPNPKPIVKAAAKRVAPRRVVRRKQPIRRVVARKPVRGVRSRGIKVYNP